MKIVAFMQNPWFPDGTNEYHVRLYRDDQQFHQQVLMGTMSGRRLVRAFGDLFQEIHWDNVSWVSATRACGVTEPDLDHIKLVLNNHRPDIILCFGNIARDAVRRCVTDDWMLDRALMECHHPNARHRTQADLDGFAQVVRKQVLVQEMLRGNHRGANALE